MVQYTTHVEVTVPALDITRKEAYMVEKASKRFSVWWTNKGATDTRLKQLDPDLNVPSEMIIIER